MRRKGVILRFGVIGVAVAGVYVLLYLALQGLGLPQAGANALAFGIAVLVQYAGQARFTFGRRMADTAQIVRFGVMIALGFVTSAVITGVIAPQMGLADWLAAVTVTVILPVQNFVLMTLWVFSGQHFQGNNAS
ncbi:Putative flippase GtrA (transmembrane translocase of bactoprenol-linked glucose) [Roseovarius marisflavi]|uniref:Putative flippase GtrA (Transmembrane translocase of bactoprenol-linked glucose) n=1 Tax=Roseovarius marisflavi TaxID=1054996 RepID=A0A1M6VZ11_9RHOB|nr:GtrA family protein [Roseovarius marisflavi]SHK86664.1 Putative flippase GtrA (transmembrane translocase of bactoprenol-linked glucose) [Roseovarius marisflavi]